MPTASPERLVPGAGCAGNDPHGVGSAGFRRLGEVASSHQLRGVGAGQGKGRRTGSPGQDTVPACPGVSRELGYL